MTHEQEYNKAIYLIKCINAKLYLYYSDDKEESRGVSMILNSLAKQVDARYLDNYSFDDLIEKLEALNRSLEKRDELFSA